MPNWNEEFNELKQMGTSYDILRRKYIKELFNLTNRNVIIYYSAFLEKPDIDPYHTMINESDKTGFMTTIHKLDKKLGLDLILHTPGGDSAATESLVDYLRSIFGNDIRVIVPQIAMSAGTMIACSAKSIVMGKQSSLGPIDPQIGGIPAHGIIEEVESALAGIKKDPESIPIWQVIFSKYHPTLIGECEKAIHLSEEMVSQWLKTGMFAEDDNKDQIVDKIVEELGNHALTKSHSRHLSAKKCKEIGLKIELLEDDQPLQDAVLSLHHACMHTLNATPVYKIVENQNGITHMRILEEDY